MLSSLLADAHVSILNVSTYDSDFILVQEADVTRAADMIRESLESGLARMGARPLLSPTVPTDDSALSERETISLDDADGGETSGTHVGSSGADSVDTLGDSRPASAAERAPLRQREGGAAWAAHGAAPSSAAGGTAAEAGAEAASGAKQPSVAFAGCKPSAFDAKRRELYLKGAHPQRPHAHRGRADASRGAWRVPRCTSTQPRALPPPPPCPRLSVRAVLEPTLTVTRLSERALHDVSSALLRLLLVRTSERDHFWSYACVTDGPGDVSLVMDEGAAELFADGAITGTCGAWRAVRLCGHRFGFDETGVVSTMLSSVYARNIPTMCLSTFATSITIVEDASLEEALDSFRAIVPRVVWAGAEDAERAAQALSIR